MRASHSFALLFDRTQRGVRGTLGSLVERAAGWWRVYLGARRCGLSHIYLPTPLLLDRLLGVISRTTGTAKVRPVVAQWVSCTPIGARRSRLPLPAGIHWLRLARVVGADQNTRSRGAQNALQTIDRPKNLRIQGTGSKKMGASCK